MTPAPIQPTVEQPLTTESQQTLTSQQTNRNEVQEKYERLYGQTQQQSSPVEQPVITTSTTPPSTDTTSVILAELQRLQSEVASVKTAVTPAPPKVEEIQLTPWFEQLRQGKFEDAEADLTRRIEAKIRSEVIQEATHKANENLQVQVEIDRFLNDMRGKNPELVEMEYLLTAPVQSRIEQAQASKKINGPVDFLREYKEAVMAETNKLREITLKYRAQGQQQATTRQQDERNAATLPHQAVSSTNAESTPGEVADPNLDYFARRRAGESRLRNMS